MKPIEITRDNFTEEVANSPVPVLIDLWAPWCGPCRMMAPVIDEIAESAEGFKVGKVNVDEQMEIAASLRVRSIPTLDGERARLQPILGTPINMLNLPKGCAFCPRCDEAMKICLEEVPEELPINENHKAACWINVRDGKTTAGKENGDE